MVPEYKSIHREGFEILTPKQMLQRLPIALGQVELGNAFWKMTIWNKRNCFLFVLSEINY